MRIHWVTWWPVPYWTERFAVLSRRPGVSLRVFFLADGGAELDYSKAAETWPFEHEYLSDRRAAIGYYSVDRRIVSPLPVIRGRPDVVVTNYGSMTTALLALLTTVTRIPRLVFVPNTADEPRRSSLVAEATKRWIFRSASGILATGRLQESYAGRYVRRTERIHRIGNPAPPLAGQAEAPRDEARPRPTVLFVGRFVEEKGLECLLEACSALEREGVSLRLVLVGEGPLRPTLERMATDLGLGVDFKGFKEGRELAQEYEGADVFVLPSQREPWGLVVNEAMAFGLPVVVSDRVGARDALVQDGVNGRIFTVGSRRDLAEKLRPLLQSHDLRAHFGEASRALIRQHTVDDWADAVVDAVARYV